MKRFCIGAVRWYQRHISAGRPPACRFLPTCSEYTVTAIERFGVIRGIGLGVWRILRCNPFGKGGFDPVPEKKIKK